MNDPTIKPQRMPAWPRFSLLTLMLATLFLGMALAIVLLTLELIPLRAEVQQLRNEAGYLTIDDPTKIHAIGVDTDSPLLWKWKVYFPPAKGVLGVHAILGELPPAGEEPSKRSGVTLDGSAPVEGVITARLHRDVNDIWQFETEFDGGSAFKSRFWHQVTQVTEEQISALKGAGPFTYGSVSVPTAVGESDAPFVLYRQRFLGDDSASSKLLKSGGPGILIWLRLSEPEP